MLLPEECEVQSPVQSRQKPEYAELVTRKNELSELSDPSGNGRARNTHELLNCPKGFTFGVQIEDAT